MKRPVKDAGFTLLEMLVAISVLGLLSMSIASGLHVGSDGFIRARLHTATADRMAHADRLLKTLIAGTYPAFAEPNLDDRRIAFAGEPQNLTFITRLPQIIGSPAMVAARLHIAEMDGQPALILDWRLDLPGADEQGSPPETSTVIATGVSGISLAYFGAAEPNAPPAWQQSWADKTTLPSLIRITLQDDTQAKTPWPDLVAAPLATGNTACIYDPTDVECRRIR
jgi:general secretion pathway protein J